MQALQARSDGTPPAGASILTSLLNSRATGGAAGGSSDVDLDTEKIKEWRSIVTLIVFVAANCLVLYPLYIPIYVPKFIRDAAVSILAGMRICRPRADCQRKITTIAGISFARFVFPLNFVTGPLIANLFLLAILAIGREEVAAGTIGTHNISPIDIMAFFITLAYIAVSLDASGLIRFLAYKVLQWGGKSGRRLFFYLYMFWFSLTAFIGNDPIILSGTPFLAYMTRVAKNIESPRAWIYTQFTMANVASAILVSSNPTNLVLAGAFSIRFIDYTANIVVPVIITAVLLFPFLLYVVFRSESLVPSHIEMHELSEEARARKPINPNIPTAAEAAKAKASGHVSDSDSSGVSGADLGKSISLEEIMNPYVDKWSACFIATIMAVTILTVLAINAGFATSGKTVPPAFYCTIPGAFVAFCWDLGAGWLRRHESREIARRGASHVAMMQQADEDSSSDDVGPGGVLGAPLPRRGSLPPAAGADGRRRSGAGAGGELSDEEKAELERQAAAMSPRTRARAASTAKNISDEEKQELDRAAARTNSSNNTTLTTRPSPTSGGGVALPAEPQRTTVSTLCARAWHWGRETFPNATHVLSLLPWALIPFAFSMFVLVQALVTKGWIPVFAYGWDHWVEKTGTVGAIGGMGFLAVILCNFAGTNIGTTILLSRVIQAWQEIHRINGIPISNRTFWATVYSMALGVNYGAFSLAFSGALAGLLWRDILSKKHIHVGNIEFARVNLPMIVFTMIVGSCALLGEVWIMRGNEPYDQVAA